MKNLKQLIAPFLVIFGLVVLVFAASATKVLSQDLPQQESCIVAADIMKTVAEAKDNRLPPEDAFMFFIGIGLPPQVADSMTRYLYFVHQDKTANEVYIQFMSDCLGEPA